MIERLRNPSREADIHAIRLLAKMGGNATEAIGPLVELTKSNEPTLVRIEAAKSGRAIRLKRR